MSTYRLFSPNTVGVISLVGLTSWFSGAYLERLRSKAASAQHRPGPDDNGWNPLPALPIFGSVSAAAPFEPKREQVSPPPANRTSEIMKYGFPSLDNVRSFDDFVLSYDRRTRNANWVFEHLTKESIKRTDGVDRSLCDFTEDTSIHPYFRATNNDYLKSGFDRGHLAAAGNHRQCQKYCDQTFLLTNISPQVGVGFNRDSWNRLEKYVRKLAKQNQNVYVCTGPLFLPFTEADGKMYVKYQVIGKNHVAVPTHFFKVVVIESNDGKYHMESYVMPNKPLQDDTPLAVYRRDPVEIEKSAGLLFFDRLMRQKLASINGLKTTYV